ncbi:hypothetical protein CDSE_0038 [Candidatus Kinetoplastibacterium desouzaii TCC079E]|uniref:N-acetyltransferase domain-containing protein n=1 Tax=Candidatus Kinetoplastidibacterium desouzai TCC079E TaxID=1208919 RepID=M1M4M8_9PROT|nr:GNAT family N-acetyltransferase [Candidatus Kinetoplastibacterium desouzaii]AGF47160.1 hypothetical protein CDSE_0038 [Candidatus Kinetoplastibacterium desouzaii TCC079E]
MSRHFLNSLFDPNSIFFFIDARVKIKLSFPSNPNVRTAYFDYNSSTGFYLKKGYFTDYSSDNRLDLAVICMPSGLITNVLNFLVDFRPRSVIVLSCQYDRSCSKTIDFCKQWAMTNQCELLGPESSGIQRPQISLNLGLHTRLARAGKVALLAQSKSIVASIMDWAEDINIGFSLVASIGKKDFLSVSKILDYLIYDPYTESIVLYLEDIMGIAREFVSSLRALARIKPVIVLKTGKNDRNADIAFSAVMRRAGAVRVHYFVQLFSAVKALSYPKKIYGRNIVLLSNGSGPPQLALDMLGNDSVLLKSGLSVSTLQYLETFIDKDYIQNNVIVVHRAFTIDILDKVINCLLNDKNVDGVLILLAPDFSSEALNVIKYLSKSVLNASKPIIICLMGDAEMKPLRKLLDDSGVFTFRTPESAACAMQVLAEHYYNQQMLLQVQPSIPFSPLNYINHAQKIIKTAILKKHLFLDVKEISSLFELFNINLNFSNNIDLDQEIGPFSINIWSDSIFGPIISLTSLAKNNIFVSENIGIDIPPLNNFLASRLMERSGIYQDNINPIIEKEVFNNLQRVLVQVSELISEFPEIESLNLSGCFVGKTYLRSLNIELLLKSDSSIALFSKKINYPHMAIHPYPVNLVKKHKMNNGAEYIIRPIRPEDAEILQDFIRCLSDKSRYMRFISAMRELTPRMLAHYTQVDYHRELALVAVIPKVSNYSVINLNNEKMIAFVHYLYNEDGLGVEYALVVSDDWQRLGIGRQMMIYLIQIARERKLDYIEGYVLRKNKPMLSLLKNLGFSSSYDEEDNTMCIVRFDLNRQYLDH